MTMTLDELMKGLEFSTGLDKQAEEKKDPEKDEKKDEKDAKKEIFKSKEEIDKAEKDVVKAEGENDKEQEQCKEARLKGAALAQEVMSKVAALKINTDKESEMNKEASAAGRALADALLTKLAAAGDMSTENGITPGTVPTKSTIDNAQMVAEQGATIKPMPTGNGIRNEGTINQILEGIVADAISQGATSFGQGVEAKAAPITAAEGRVEDSAVPNQVDDESAEKAAAVSSLVSEGYDFMSAVEMVKSAAEEIEYEETQQIKQAAIGALLDRGVDFDTAVEMVKKAGVVSGMMDAAKGAASKTVNAVARNPKAIAAGGAGYIAGRTVSSIGQEKKAAVNALIDSGVEFDQAVAMVNAKATELYGK